MMPTDPIAWTDIAVAIGTILAVLVGYGTLLVTNKGVALEETNQRLQNRDSKVKSLRELSKRGLTAAHELAEALRCIHSLLLSNSESARFSQMPEAANKNDSLITQYLDMYLMAFDTLEIKAAALRCFIVESNIMLGCKHMEPYQSLLACYESLITKLYEYNKTFDTLPGLEPLEGVISTSTVDFHFLTAEAQIGDLSNKLEIAMAAIVAKTRQFM